MEKIIVSGYEPRKYTNAFYDYLVECGYISEDNPLSNLLYWLSDDDVRAYAQVNFEIEFVDEEEEEEDDE